MRTSTRTLSRRGPAVIAALACSAALVWAGDARSDVALYEVTVPLRGATEADRAAGMTDALRAVAVRASGRREAADSPAIAAAKPANYVQRYSTTADRMLKVGFDARATEQLLQQAGLPLWPAERPVTRVSAPVGDPAALEAAAAWRGLPIVWSGAESADDRAGAVLSGAPSGTEFAWSFTYDGRTVQARGTAQDGVNLAADTLASRFAPPSTRSSVSLTLRIGGMDDLAHYAGLLACLRELSLVRNVEVESLEGSVVAVRVTVRGDRELLARVAALEGRLQPVPPDAEAAAPAVDFIYQP